MNKIPSLFLLIKSLNSSEKRQIKLNIGKKNAQYLKLWGVLEKLKSYNSNEVRAKLGNSSLSKHLAFHKNYLFNLILKHLSFSESESHSDTDIQKLTISSDILIRKNLIPEAMGLLDRAHLLCYHSEKIFFLPEILLRKMYLLELEGKQKASQTHKQLSEEYLDVLTTLGYEPLFHSIRFEANSKEKLPSEEAGKFLTQLEKLPIKTMKGYSLKQFYFLSILCLIATGDFEKALGYCDLLFALIRSPTGQNSEKRGRELFLVLYEKVKLCIYLENEPKLKECIEALQGFQTSDEREGFLNKRLLLLLFLASVDLFKGKSNSVFDGFSFTGSWTKLVSKMSPRENREILEFSIAIFYKRKDFSHLLKVISFCESNEEQFNPQLLMRARFRLLEGLSLLEKGEPEVAVSRINGFLKIQQFGTLPIEIRTLLRDFENIGKMDPNSLSAFREQLYNKALPFACL